MSKIFSKKVFINTLITYILVGITFVFGYCTYEPTGFIDFGPVVTAMAIAVLAFPVIVVLMLISIIIRTKTNRKNIIIGYILSVVIVALIIIAILVAFYYYSNLIYEKERLKHVAEQKVRIEKEIEQIENSIGDEIYRVYPEAKISNGYDNHVTVKLEGYTYENQPDMEIEEDKWRELLKTPTISGYEHSIAVEYYFEDTSEWFATIYVNTNFKTVSHFYSSLGISQKGRETIKLSMQEYLKEYYDNFYVDIENSDYKIDVKIYKKLNDNEEKEAEKIWKDFLVNKNINTELVSITTLYLDPDKDFSFKGYDVSSDYWYGKYD